MRIAAKISGLLIYGVFLFACSETVRERPRETWVFRSVLDQQARMVTILLHEDLYVAYNVQNGGLYKAWKGDVVLEGAVYNTVHGPQPTSTGYDFYSSKEEPAWELLKGDAAVPFRYDYKGHRFDKGQVTLVHELVSDEGKLTIYETPEFVPGGEFERVFNVIGDGDLKAKINVTFTSMADSEDYDVDGDYRLLTEGPVERGETKLYQASVELMLLPGDEVNTRVKYFLPQGSSDQMQRPAETLDLIEGGKALVFNNDCKTCHNETQKTVGPSYKEIAEMYPFDQASIEMLGEKIIAGGSGVFGEIPMTPHPDLDPESAQQMVSYILSLDGEEFVKSDRNSHFLQIASVPMSLSEDQKHQEATDKAPGLAVEYYKMESSSDFSEQWLSESAPILNGIAPLIHVDKSTDFGPYRANFALDIRGFIEVEEEKNYSFRLVSDDGSKLIINGQTVIDHGGLHGPDPKDGEVILRKGFNDIRIVYFQGGGGAALSWQWRNEQGDLEIVPEEVLSHTSEMFSTTVPYIDKKDLLRSIPGDQNPVQGVHPSFKLSQARPDDFKPRVGGMDFLSDGRMVVCTWDSLGPVYVLDGVQSGDPGKISVTQVASGLAEPLGLKVVDDEIYVLQKQELTRLIDSDGDGIMDIYETVSDDWKVSANFHEFAFGLVYKDGYFYATLATAILPGGASANPQIPDRGKVIKIKRDGSSAEFVSHGLRTPNGIGIGVDDEIFVADNQGDWLPSSKIVHIKPGSWQGSRSVDFEGTEGLEAHPPVAWLPQDEIGNSPSTPLIMNAGPYKGQMIHGEVTHGGIKRVFVENIDGVYQGSLFRFTQGLEAGVNRILWGPEGALYAGGVGSSGNWSHYGTYWYGLQRLEFEENKAFEMKTVSARSNGFEIEMTQPIGKSEAIRKEDIEVQQWYYLPTEKYGGPKMDLEDLEIESIHMNEERTRLFLELNGMKEDHVVYIRFKNPMRSENQSEMWSTETWYTLNKIPADKPGFNNPVEFPHNSLTENEIQEGWRLLFDGQTTSGWHNFKKDKIGSAWLVRNGELHLSRGGGGDIVTDEEFENFELTLDWKIVVGGNSGIMWNVSEDDKYRYPWQTGPEMQILDNAVHSDGKFETHRAGDLYDMIACKFVTSNPGGEWNTTRLVSNNGKMEHWLNGYKVVEYEMHTDDWKEMVAGSKFRDMSDFGINTSGHIAIQDHGDKLWLRNIKIREL